jgi:hypothetical protein
LSGALYPWQSGSNGREETQHLHLNPKSGRWLPDNTHLQRHVNHAIAYNVWQYYKATGDLEFLSTYGAEMILEIARFLAGITTFNPELDRYEILGVMGPDEYHDGYPDSEKPGLNNNAYTNVMTVYVLRTALKAIERSPPKEGMTCWKFGTGTGGTRSLAGYRPQDAGRISRRSHHQPVRGVRSAAGVRLGGVPGKIRQHPAAGPDSRGGRGHPQPL